MSYVSKHRRAIPHLDKFSILLEAKNPKQPNHNMVRSRNLYPSSCSKWFLLTLNDYYFFRNIETHNQAKMSETLGLTYYGYDSIKLEQVFLSTVTILELKGKPRKIWSYKKYTILEFVTSWMSRKILNLCDTKIHRLCGYLSTL